MTSLTVTVTKADGTTPWPFTGTATIYGKAYDVDCRGKDIRQYGLEVACTDTGFTAPYVHGATIDVSLTSGTLAGTTASVTKEEFTEPNGPGCPGEGYLGSAAVVLR